ncbi:DNA cytosine methyltransferase [Pseudogemmobacter humi]|uniref:DNA (cytosine-5-)-methyltransferase n=1 Tax=Pseudogemmobacter humi TaxID=2483812 RepID=A0A3P5XKQ0_9RHOB|nr:DNA cytosine methyltransferase [Pseudogemmobacter humi]VDC28265.1 C-5 cytosine-specific DNA methylase [Pseudogemmobacter humi]
MLDFPMIIDSFAGGGGASTGIELALGRSPDVAINHSAAALALHAANHPETLHLDSNIWDVEPAEVAKGRKVGLLWASPDCKHFSKAKGGAPRDRNIRDLAWIVVKWAEHVKPDVILMENVEEFVTWGPLGEDGQPIKELAGVTFELWLKRLRKAGYRVQWRELRACDYGAPTIRKRWFLVARRDGQPISWPKPTHGDPKSPAVRKGKLLPWRSAAECIDWREPCPSIFDSRAEILDKHGLRAQRPLKPNTLHRIARGIARYVLEAERPFIVNLTHGGREEDLAEPIRTITGAHRGEKALVVPSIVGCGGRAGQSRPRGGDEPFATITTKADACVITPALATYYGHGEGRGVRGAELADPLRTVTVENRHALIAPSITRFNGGATRQDLRDPLATVTANSWIKKPGGAAPLGLIAPCLASLAHGYSGGRREYSLEEALGTVTVGGIQHALVAPHLLSLKGSSRRMAPIDRPHPTVLAEGNHSALIAASMIQTGYGERPGQEARALDIGKPLGTVVAGGVKHAPVAAFLAQQNNDSRRIGGVNPGRPAGDPLSTICASGSHQNLTTAWFAKYYGTGDGARMDEPAHTITVKDRLAHMQADLAAPPFGPEHEPKARAVADLLREYGLWDDREFVTLSIDGAEFVIVDVGMRMLTPRELFRAQGFPDHYVIEGVWEGLDGDNPTFRPFPKDVQVSCCGNSVCPPLAEALVRANCAHLIVREEAA